MANKYINSYFKFLKNSLATDMEYRVSFLFKNLTGLVWMIGALFFIEVLFSQASSIGGWSKIEIIFLYLCFSLSVDFYFIFIKENLHKLSQLIRHGELDGYLLKPINLRFLLSFMTEGVGTYVIFRFLTAIFLLFYFQHQFALVIPFSSWVLFFSFILSGSLGVYSISFAIHTLNIWLVRLYNVTDFTNQSYELAKIPLDSWPKYIQYVLIYIFPIGVLSSFAVKALLGKIGLLSLLITLVVAFVLFVLTQLFFNFALRHYSSASS